MSNDPIPDTRPMKLPPVVDRIARQNDSSTNYKVPICLLMVGMAGSGKTTLMARLQQSTMMLSDPEEDNDGQTDDDDNKDEKPKGKQQERQEQETKESTKEQENETENAENLASNVHGTGQMPAYCMNLDPATLHLPYHVSIDIRDTVDYKQVMAQHKLGPNGAIMTSLNLYATKFDQVINILETRADDPASVLSDYLLVDTPGQIEAFTWSASGSIISESLASSFPTVIVFVVDTARCASSPTTFMSNMLYACSMYYRTRLPLVICFNKIDVVSHEFCMEWMKDFESFQSALDTARSQRDDGIGSGGGFYDSLTRSLSLVLDEFYNAFARTACGISAVTGDGTDDFFKAVQIAATEDFQDYIGDLKFRIEEQQAKSRAMARINVKRFQRDCEDTNQT